MADTIGDLLKRIRGFGWRVATHNDYRLNNEFHTFYLFTRQGSCLKGEAKSDEAALLEVLRQAYRFEMPGWRWAADGAATHWTGAMVYNWNGLWAWNNPEKQGPNHRYNSPLISAAVALGFVLQSDDTEKGWYWRRPNDPFSSVKLNFGSEEAAARHALRTHEEYRAENPHWQAHLNSATSGAP